MADSFVTTGNYTAAMNLYRQAAIDLPGDSRPLVGMAGLYWRAGSVEQAARLYRQVLTIEPLNSDAAGGVAEELLYLGNAAEAIGFINQFLVQGQGTGTLFNALGVAYDLIGNQDGAQLAYAEGLDMEPGDPAILNNLALSFAVRGDYQTAVGLIQQSLDAPESQRQSRQNLALIYALSGQVDAAVEIAATVLSDEEVAINRVFYSRLAPLSTADKATAVFLGKLPELSRDEGPTGLMADISNIINAPPSTPEPDPDLAPEAIIEPIIEPLLEQDSPDTVETPAAEKVETATAEAPQETPANLPAEPFEAPIILEDDTILEQDTGIPLSAELPGDTAKMTPEYPPYWIQLGSYRSLARVGQGWRTLAGAHDALMGHYEPHVQSYESADRGAFERLLLAGFETRSAANLLCGELQMAGVDCLVLKTSGNIRLLSDAEQDEANTP